MNQRLPVILQPLQPYLGGFFYAYLWIKDAAHALILSPKAEGEFLKVIWNNSYDDVSGAMSFYDGRANTLAMAEAGSALAKKIIALRIGGFDDWCLPAIDQLEPLYRIAKPGTDENSCYMRSGINLSAMPQTYPYTPEFPTQTTNELFRAGGSESMDERAYWTSTQYAGSSSGAWSQGFNRGGQVLWSKDDTLAARAVRMVKL